jgi:hypothetical protein
VNVPTNFLERAASFLHCKIGSLPFVYLGLPVGANPRRVATWEHVVKTIEKWFFLGGTSILAWRGRVILINLVLASIPVFYLSFLKMPSSVKKSNCWDETKVIVGRCIGR